MSNMTFTPTENNLQDRMSGDWLLTFSKYDGVFYFNNPKYEIDVMATPNWNEDGITPVDINTGGDPIHVMDLAVDFQNGAHYAKVMTGLLEFIEACIIPTLVIEN